MWELGQRAPSGANLERYLEVIRAFKQVVSASTGVDEALIFGRDGGP